MISKKIIFWKWFFDLEIEKEDTLCCGPLLSKKSLRQLELLELLFKKKRRFHISELSEQKGGSMGLIANIIAGLVGSSVGQSLLGSWGPSLAGMAIIPSIVGAVIVVAVVSYLFGRK